MDSGVLQTFICEHYYIMKASDGNKVVEILSDIKSTNSSANDFLSVTGLCSVSGIASKYFKTDAPTQE